MKYLVNFNISKQGFSEIVDVENKADAIDQARQYLANRITELDHSVSVTPIYTKPLLLTKEMEVKWEYLNNQEKMYQ